MPLFLGFFGVLGSGANSASAWSGRHAVRGGGLPYRGSGEGLAKRWGLGGAESERSWDGVR